MSTQKPKPTAGLPSDLDAPRAKLVYLYLSQTGEASVRDITDELDMQRLTAYSVLKTLVGEGLVSRDGDRYAPVTQSA